MPKTTSIDAPVPASSLLGENYLSHAQVAKGFGISPRTLFRLHTQRQGPPRVRVGKKVLYRRESLLAWLASREESPRKNPTQPKGGKRRKAA